MSGRPISFLASLPQSISQPVSAPAMLPMQPGLQMPAGKGTAQGPMAQQLQMQASPNAGKPMDLQALIQSLMSSGLLSGL
jgi:hypothetical protein